jgi:hypothetical protein
VHVAQVHDKPKVLMSEVLRQGKTWVVVMVNTSMRSMVGQHLLHQSDLN